MQAIEKATTEMILIQAEEQAKRDFVLDKELAVLREAIGENVKFEKNFQEIIDPVMLAQRTIEALCEAQAARVHAENQYPDLSKEIGEISTEAYLKVISRAVRKMEPFEKPRVSVA